MASEDERQLALNNALAQIERQFGKGSIMRMGEFQERMAFDIIPTGSIALDLALGVGGFPRGRIVEIYGPESSGKTTLALHAIAEAQKTGGTAAFIDVEHALDPNYAAALGVDLDNLLVSQPDTGEQALEIAEMLVAQQRRRRRRGRLGRRARHQGRARRRHGRRARRPAGAADVAGAAQADRGDLAQQDGDDLHQPAARENRRDVRQSRDDLGRPRAEVLRLGSPRRPQARTDQDRARRRRHAHARQSRQEQGRAAVPPSRVRHHLRPRHLEDGLDPRRRARAEHRRQERLVVHLRRAAHRPRPRERQGVPRRAHRSRGRDRSEDSRSARARSRQPTARHRRPSPH